jgi:hypothetical protein
MRHLGTVVKVPADKATGNPGIPHECDHHVSEILTHALPLTEGHLQSVNNLIWKSAVG